MLPPSPALRFDREDVLDAIQLSVAYIAGHDDGLVVDALHPHVIGEPDLRAWELDPLGTAERLFPGARSVVDRFGLDISAPPLRPTTQGWAEIGYAPSRHFGTWVEQVTARSDDEVRTHTCDY